MVSKTKLLNPYISSQETNRLNYVAVVEVIQNAIIHENIEYLVLSSVKQVLSRLLSLP